MDYRSFKYTVQADDLDSDGLGIAADALTLNGGSIRSLTGVDAVLDLGSHTFAADPTRKVDGRNRSVGGSILDGCGSSSSTARGASASGTARAT